MHDRPRALRTLLNPAQRPVVQQQEHKRESDDHGLRHQAQNEQTGKRQVPLPVWFTRIPTVGPEGREEEEGAEDVFAFSDPGYRLNIDGMKGEQRGHEQAGPKTTGGVHQQQEKEDGIRGVNQEAGEVVSGRILMEKLVVKRMRQPGERMPVSLLGSGHGPSDGVPVQALVDVRVLGDVAVVVIIDEGMAVDRVVERQGRDYQKKAQDDIALFGRREKTCGLSWRGWQRKDLTTEDTEDAEVLASAHLFCHVTNVTDVLLP